MLMEEIWQLVQRRKSQISFIEIWTKIWNNQTPSLSWSL